MNDFKLAWRQLMRRPGFSAVAIVTVALGIAANAVVFIVAKGILYRPTLIAEPDRVVWVQAIRPEGGPERRMSFADLETLRANGLFEEAALFGTSGGGVWDNADRMVPLRGLQVTAGLLKVLGIQPVLGAMFDPADNDAIMISHELWQGQMEGRMDIVGQKIIMREKPRTIAGVLPKGLEFPWGRIPYGGTGAAAKAGVQDMWSQLKFGPPTDDGRSSRHFHVVARLKPGRTLASAREEAATIAQQLAVSFPKTNQGVRFELEPLPDHTLGRTRTGLIILSLAAVAVWLVGCVNLANLLLARGLTREREFSVRVALGAAPRDLIRPILTESFVIALLGGAVGILIAWWSVEGARRLGPVGVPFLNEVRLDWPGVFFSLALSAATAVAFGLAPAVRHSRARAMDALRGGARLSAGPGVRAWQQSLIVSQVALSLALLLSAGLLLESFRRIWGLNLGYNPERVVAMDLHATKNAPTEMDIDRARGLRAHLAALPGVTAVGAIQSIPLTGRWTFTEKVHVDGRDTPEDQRPVFGLSMVAFDYFKAIGTPIIAGRVFRDEEMSEKGYPPVTVINETAARLLFPGQSALGQRMFYRHNKKRPYEIIGIVQDTRDVRVEEKAQPAGYITMAFPDAQFIVRTSGDAAATAPMLRQAVERFDKRIVIHDVRPLQAIVSGQTAERRFLALLLGTFAAIALSIAGVGVFGVMAYQVAQRRREFGVRIALGAQPADVLRLVLSWGGRITLIGIALGLPLALAAASALRSQLFEISAWNPWVFSIALLTLLAGAQLACWVPARRAARVEPMEALRCE